MENIPNRFDRIVAILIQLQSRKVIKAQELADRFGVSLRTIYRDIKSLGKAGVPIIGEAGAGYSIMEGYRLPPVMFTQEEAGSFVTAEKLMRQFTDEMMSRHFTTAMLKVRSVLRSREKDLMELLEHQMDIFSPPSSNKHRLSNALPQLVKSMLSKQQIRLHYQSMNQPAVAQRNIEPVGIFHENRYWYIYGWCHLRHDYRQFRIDRIHQLQVTDKSFARNHPSLYELRSRLKNAPATRVRIKVKKSMAPYLKSGWAYHGFVSEKPDGEWVEMIFDSPDAHTGFARWLLMFADHVEILEPDSLRDTMHRILQKALAHLD